MSVYSNFRRVNFRSEVQKVAEPMGPGRYRNVIINLYIAVIYTGLDINMYHFVDLPLSWDEVVAVGRANFDFAASSSALLNTPVQSAIAVV